MVLEKSACRSGIIGETSGWPQASRLGTCFARYARRSRAIFRVSDLRSACKYCVFVQSLLSFSDRTDARAAEFLSQVPSQLPSLNPRPQLYNQQYLIAKPMEEQYIIIFYTTLWYTITCICIVTTCVCMYIYIYIYILV